MFSLTIARMPSAASSADVEPHRVGDRLHRRARRVHVELHLAAEEPRRQMADDDVRVGHGRVGAALAVRGGAGLGAGGLRADAERLRQLGHVRDRAAARADRVHVDGRDAEPEVRDRRLAPDRRLAAERERDVGGRAAHVERQHVLEPRLPRDVERAGDAAGRAGEHAVDRIPRRLARRHQTGVGAEDVDLRGRADRLQVSRELPDVVGDPRPHVRVHAGRQRALVLAELGQHVRRDGDREARVEPLDDRSDLLLVPRRDVRVDERDRQRLDARLDEVADRGLGLRRRRPASPCCRARPCARRSRACPRARPADRA